MNNLKLYLESIPEVALEDIPLSFHSTFYPVYERIKKWSDRFPQSTDNSIFNDLTLLYLLAPKKYFDHRNPAHLFRLILSINFMQKKLLHAATFSPDVRHLEIRWISTNLTFPFSFKPVLGCLIGFNLMDRYEVFDEENIILALQKYLPQLRLVKESSYCHTSQHKNFKIFYFEIEQKNGLPFSHLEKKLLRSSLDGKIKNSIQPLSPTIFMSSNNEEIYKNILILSQEIESIQDLPQTHITLDQQSGKEVVFRVTLVYVSPSNHFSLKERFFNSSFVSEKILTVKYIEDHPVQAHVFRLHLPREISFLRSDGSLDFYSTRQKIVSQITDAIGEFRDYNGGILLKQQELLDGFKANFPDLANSDLELMEIFFYGLTPLEKQVAMLQKSLSKMFTYFLENRSNKFSQESIYSFKIYREEQETFLVIHGMDSSLASTIRFFFEEHPYGHFDIAYNIIDSANGVFFNAVLLQTNNSELESFIQDLQEVLRNWNQSMSNRQFLRIALNQSIVSLDPRIGGEASSSDILRLLFEGLTRIDQNGHIENAVAESIEVFSNSKQYVFKLRSSLWNDGSFVSAYDFEYAWKKILSPEFKTAFASLFYPIKNAKEAKEGKVSPDQIGIHVLNDRTLVIDLVHPTPYFLQLTALPLYSPVHRLIDQQHPQWPYECETNYPCNGPFQLKLNQPIQGYQLIKNPYYWDTYHAAIDQITLTFMNPAQAIQAFQKNELDWIGDPFGSWHPFYTPRKEDRIVSLSDSWVCWCIFNTAKPPFHHRKLRQAFAYAIERAQIIANALLPLNPAFSPLLPRFRKNNQFLFPEHNVDKARKLFHEALQELNMSKEDFPTLSLMYHEKGEQKYTALCLQQQFQQCFNIECNFVPLSWKTLFNKFNQGNFQMGLLLWTSWIDDPIYTLNPFKTAKQELNFTKWEHAEFQQLLDLSDQEVNPFQRSSYLLNAEGILSHEMPIIPLFYRPHQALISKDLRLNCKSPCFPFNIAKSFFNNKRR